MAGIGISSIDWIENILIRQIHGLWMVIYMSEEQNIQPETIRPQIQRPEMQNPEMQNPEMQNKVWIWMFMAVAILAALVVAWLGRGVGIPALLLALGASLIAVISALTVFFTARSTDVEDQPADGAGDYRDVVSKLPQPALIVQNGQPIFCNAPYLALAEEMGVESAHEDKQDCPPAIERLFSDDEDKSTATIFRLYHANDAIRNNSEIFRTIDKKHHLRTYKVSVHGLNGVQLWLLRDLDEDEETGGSLLARAPVGLFCVSKDGDVLDVNEVLEGWLGLEPGQVLTHVHEFIENPGALLDGEIAKGRILRADTRMMTFKGVVSPVVMVAKWDETESGALFASVALYGHSGLSGGEGQMTLVDGGAKPAAKADAGPDLPARIASDTSPFGILFMDNSDLKQAQIRAGNPAALALVGADLPPKTLFKSLFTQDEALRGLLDKGINVKEGPIELQLVHKHNDGDVLRSVDVYFSNPDRQGCFAYLIDISARKELENQLLQSQKMQAIGQLAGGVAHDFNNLLTAIRLNTDELLGRHPIGDPSYPELQKINQTVARATGLVRKLLAFSRKQTLRTQVLDVTETLSDLSILLKQVLVEKVKLDVVHGRSLAPIQADKNQLETVLMNLCVNARDAMAETGGGTITLQSSAVTSEELKAQGIEARTKGSYIRFDVIDTGTGMDEETQAKIFEPFFTTKAQGKGTGLGLATVYGIVQQSGGHLRVKSQPGKGTTFSVYMPTATGALAATTPVKKKQVEPERNKPSDLAGTGTILFVEDEGAVRAIAAKTLRKRGYEVIEAEDGEEAFEILESGAHKFDLMISDVIMPGMDGPTLLRTGRKFLGEAKIVFISGYAEEEFSDLLSEEQDVTFLPKPFSLVQLAEKVKIVLDDE